MKARLDILEEWVSRVKAAEMPEARASIFGLMGAEMTPEEYERAKPIALEIVKILMAEDEGLHYPLAIVDSLASKFKIDLLPMAKSEHHRKIIERVQDWMGAEPPKSNGLDADTPEEALANLKKAGYIQ